MGGSDLAIVVVVESVMHETGSNLVTLHVRSRLCLPVTSALPASDSVDEDEGRGDGAWTAPAGRLRASRRTLPNAGHGAANRVDAAGVTAHGLRGWRPTGCRRSHEICCRSSAVVEMQVLGDCEFLTVDSVRLDVLYVLVFLEISSRRVILCNATANPAFGRGDAAGAQMWLDRTTV